MPALIGLWVFLAIVIGFFGRKYRFGFWGFFFATILFTPIIGTLMLIAAMPKRTHRKVVKSA